MSEYDDNPHDEMISRLYRSGSSGEPPAHLDRKILDEAQRAVNRRQWIRAWPSLATAAVLVLSFTLLLRVLEQQPLDRPMQLDEKIEQDVGEAENSTSTDAVTDNFDMAAPPQAPAAPAIIRRKAARPEPQQPAKAPERKLKVEVEGRPASYIEPQLQYDKAEPPVGGSADAAQTKGAVVATPSAAAAAEEKSRREMEAAPEVKGCGVDLPVAGLPASAWQQLYKELLDQGKSEQARCLMETFESQFGYKLELGNKP